MKDENKHSNVIPFPGLAKRLVDKGMDALVDKEFRQAAELFAQAIEINEMDEKAQFGLVVASIELGKYQEAKEYCHQLLKKGIGDYFELMEMYVMILLELNEYDEMTATIRALLEEGHVPFEKEEQFQKMLEFSQRTADEQVYRDEYLNQDESESCLHLSSKSNQELLLIIQGLKDDNIRKYLSEIKEFLQSVDGHPFLKTMLLLLMKDQGVMDECIVEKFSQRVKVIPAELEELHSRAFYQNTATYLESILEHENPSLLQFAQQLLERNHFLLFPIEPVDEFNNFAAAFHILAEQYQGIISDEKEIMVLYNGEITKLDAALALIHQIEEISSI